MYIRKIKYACKNYLKLSNFQLFFPTSTILHFSRPQLSRLLRQRLNISEIPKRIFHEVGHTLSNDAKIGALRGLQNP